MSCNSCPCVCVLCLGGPEELRFSAWMAVQEWRTAAAAENDLRDRCWCHPHAQAQLPAQVNHANMTFTSIYISKMHIHNISISFLIGLTLLNLYANITQACLEQRIASIWIASIAAARVCFCPAYTGWPLFFPKKATALWRATLHFHSSPSSLLEEGWVI